MDHNQYQRQYYETQLGKRTMQPVRSAYVLRHVDRMIRAASLQKDQRILEVGAGLGKFSLPLLEHGFDLTCLDISPVMLAELAQKAATPVTTVVADVADAGRHLPREFDRAIGFFTLHHMPSLEKAFAGVAEILKPGAVLAFCEPRAWNPLYYAQITCTPGMTWRAERGIVNMRARAISSALRAVGLQPVATHSYGFFPPFFTNRRWGRGLEDAMMKVRLLDPLHAFCIFVGRKA